MRWLPVIITVFVFYTMLGLWNDGYRKIVLVNNHGHLWNLVAAIQEFMKRFQLPALVQVLDWHRAVREFFMPVGRICLGPPAFSFGLDLLSSLLSSL